MDWRLLQRLLLINFVCIIAVCSCKRITRNAESSAAALPFASELQAALDQVVSKASNYPIGISAAVKVPGYKTWTGASGFSGPNEPITPDMLFDVGSIAKNFEAALVLKLVEAELLALDDPISVYVQDYPNVDNSITIRQLLDHSSGIFNVFEHPDFPWVGTGVDYAKVWHPEEVFATFVLEPYGPPGSVQHYSSTNYLLITEIIEQVTGSNVPNQIEDYFLEPLQLENSYISMGEPPDDQFLIAHAWVDVDQDGKMEDLSGIPLTWKVSLTHPVMFSTPEDLVHWLHALYHQGTVISPVSLAEMLRYPQTRLRDPDGGIYGLGVVDYSKILGMPVIGHAGSSLGYSAAGLYLPEYGVTLAWAINTGESPAELANQLMSDTWSSLSAILKSNQTVLP